MQMIFDQHSPAFREPPRAIRVEIGAELGAKIAGWITQPVSDALPCGAHGLGIQHFIPDRVH
jgi:hypothetical protein